MNLTSYLHKRDHSQNWQLRWMVPKAARAALGRSEFTKSLRVTNQSAAEALAYAQLTEWKRQVEAVLNATPPVQVADVTQPPRSAREIEDAAVSVGYEVASERASRLIAARSASSTAYDALYEKFDAWHRRSVRDLNGGALGYWRERARKQYKARGWALDEGSAEFALFVRAMAQAGIDTFAKAKARMEGQEDRYQPSSLVDKTIAARQRRAKAGETVLELFENYAAQRLAERRKRTDTINQDRKVIELFVGYVGEDRSLSSIDAIEVREWRNAIAALPPAFRKHNANAGLSLREAADKARALGVKGISASTVNKYLSTVSPLFDWAKQEGYVDRNPCDGLFYDLQKGKKSGKNRRPPFTTEQLNTIFKSPLFTGFARDGKEWQSGKCLADDWRYWIPLVCFFTGARIGEIAQLRIEDVRDDNGTSYIWIADNDHTGQTTKSGHSRPAPIHSKLKALGFLNFIERQRQRFASDGNNMVFPDVVPSARGQIGGLPSRFWRTYLMRIGIKSGGDGYGSHSFRHGLADQLRLAGYLDNEIEVALGHNQVSVTGGYGQVRQGTVARLAAMIENVRFEGVDFSGLRHP